MRDHPVQRLVAGVVSRQSEAGLGKRTAPLPVIGDRSQLHLTSVLRLNLPLTMTLEIAERHYRYPANTVHVTVTNLDGSNVPVATAVERLSGRVLAPVSLRLKGSVVPPTRSSSRPSTTPRSRVSGRLSAARSKCLAVLCK